MGACSLWPDRLSEVDRAFRKVQRDLADHLHGVGVEDDSAFGHHLGDLLDGEDHAGLVVGVHDRDQGRVVVELVLQLVEVELAQLVHAQLDDAVAVALQVAADGQDRRMLHAGGDDLAFLRQGGQRPVDRAAVALRAATGEDDLAGIAAQQPRHPLAGLTDPDPHLAAERVHARRVAVQAAKVRLHLLKHLIRHLRRRVVVEIDRLHLLLSPAKHVMVREAKPSTLRRIEIASSLRPRHDINVPLVRSDFCRFIPCARAPRRKNPCLPRHTDPARRIRGAWPRPRLSS